ncbi:hypothetical protein ACFQJ5_09575 [Halomicroarcula sp. GCM10025324]|uniref:hypothetical protein n=1 Tax=Haloarcula TaxID=2237 RepID=UPI0023E8C2A5|nr:hypothetical protein [Halomicroarcula sp. ZS-22-S1]
MRWHLTVALAILTVTAGCTSVTGFGDAPDEAVTPAPVPTAEPRDPIPPPGITDAGIRSVTTLSAAHRQALTNQSYTMHERYVGTLTRGNVTTTVRRNETTSVTGIRTYRHDLDRVRTFSDGRERIYRQSTYGDGQLWYERRDDGENRTFRGGEIRFGRDQFAFEGSFYVSQYLSTNETWTTPVVRNGTQFFRVVGSGGKPPWASLLGESEVYRVSLLVDSAGLVHRLDVRYVTPSEEIRHTIWYEDVGETTVEPPAWLDEATDRQVATNRTGGE